MRSQLAADSDLKEKLIKIGAKVVSHGRNVAFQMAEVAVPRILFTEILRLIAELRPPPDPLQRDARAVAMSSRKITGIIGEVRLDEGISEHPSRRAPISMAVGASWHPGRGHALANTVVRQQS